MVTSGHLSCICDAVVLVILLLIVNFMHESLGLTHIVKLSVDRVRIFIEIATRNHDVEATRLLCNSVAIIAEADIRIL